MAQAVEIVDALDRCADLCRKLAEPGAIASSSLPVPFEVKAGRAVGFTEARARAVPRPHAGCRGRVTHASILTPTAQGVANLEADMRLLAEKLVADGAAEDVVRLRSRSSCEPTIPASAARALTETKGRVNVSFPYDGKAGIRYGFQLLV